MGAEKATAYQNPQESVLITFRVAGIGTRRDVVTTHHAEKDKRGWTLATLAGADCEQNHGRFRPCFQTEPIESILEAKRTGCDRLLI